MAALPPGSLCGNGEAPNSPCSEGDALGCRGLTVLFVQTPCLEHTHTHTHTHTHPMCKHTHCR